MTTYNGKFSTKVPSNKLVHEDPKQEIQGGAEGEHYHLTAAQLALVESISSLSSAVYEPAMIAHDILTTVDGDIVMMEGS